MNLRTLIFDLHDIVYVIIFILSFGSVMREVFVAKRFKYYCKELFYAKSIVTYYISALLVIQLAECCYFKINKYLIAGLGKIIIDGGIILASILVSSGWMIDLFYKFSISNKPKIMKELSLNETEKTYIICWSCIATILTSSIFNYYICVYAAAIFLGRFAWFDTKKSIKVVFDVMDDNNPKIHDHNIVRIKTMVLLGSFLCTTIYAILRLVFHYTGGYFR